MNFAIFLDLGFLFATTDSSKNFKTKIQLYISFSRNRTLDEEGERTGEIRMQSISSRALLGSNRAVLDYIFPFYQHRIHSHAFNFQFAFSLSHLSLERSAPPKTRYAGLRQHHRSVLELCSLLLCHCRHCLFWRAVQRFLRSYLSFSKFHVDCGILVPEPHGFS